MPVLEKNKNNNKVIKVNISSSKKFTKKLKKLKC